MQTLQRTSDNFTIGMVNLPIILDNGKPIKYVTEEGKEKYRVVPDMRYPFFELDNDAYFKKVMDAYEDLKLPVYVHHTMRGYHFISLVALQKDCYAQWIKPLMKYNPKCPMVTLRIKPNKWVDEQQSFCTGLVMPNGAGDMAISELEKVKMWIEHQFIGLLKMNYYVVKYRMTGELGDL